MARPSNTAGRRAQIVEGLMRVIARKGYGGATVPAIARAARLAPGLVHYHFASKEDILLALFERLRDTLDARYARHLALRSDRPRDRLLAYLDAHLALDGDADPAALAAWVAVAAEAVRRPALGALYRRALEHRRRILADLLRRARVRRAPALAGLLLAAIEGAFHLGVAAPGTLPAGSAAPTLRSIVERMLP
ncbi:MAG TPA: helix-turn-helix domain-containing protein [Planctomycetota bacterium]